MLHSFEADCIYLEIRTLLFFARLILFRLQLHHSHLSWNVCLFPPRQVTVELQAKINAHRGVRPQDVAAEVKDDNDGAPVRKPRARVSYRADATWTVTLQRKVRMRSFTLNVGCRGFLSVCC